MVLYVDMLVYEIDFSVTNSSYTARLCVHSDDLPDLAPDFTVNARAFVLCTGYMLMNG